jgi:hypothetical protein
MSNRIGTKFSAVGLLQSSSSSLNRERRKERRNITYILNLTGALAKPDAGAFMDTAVN